MSDERDGRQSGANGSPWGEILMTYVTHGVEKQVEALALGDRLKLIESLVRPVSVQCCEPMRKTPRKHRLMKFDVDRLRVCYRLVDGEACVIFAGPHDEFDSFAARYQGNSPDRLVRIQEASFMRPPEADGHLATVEATAAPADATLPVPSPDDMRPDEDEADSFAEVFRGAFRRAVARARELAAGDLVAWGEVIREDVERVAARLDGGLGEFDAFRLAADARIDAAHATAEATRAEIDASRSALADLEAGTLARLRLVVETCEAELEAARVEFESRLDRRIEGVRADLRGVQGAQSRAEARAAEDRAEAAQAIRCALEEATGRLAGSIEDAGRASETRSRHLEDRQDAIIRTLLRRRRELKQTQDALVVARDESKALREDLDHARRVIVMISGRLDGIQSDLKAGAPAWPISSFKAILRRLDGPLHGARAFLARHAFRLR